MHITILLMKPSSFAPLRLCAKLSIPILAVFLVACCQPANPPQLAPFVSDGCSCFPEGTPDVPDLWERHCLDHDRTYWQGGTRHERKQADLKLREGIRSEGKPLTANLVYAGVRIGGTPWLPTPWRWGFGWKKFPRRYRELSGEERRIICESGNGD